MGGSIALPQNCATCALNRFLLGLAGILLLAGVIWLQGQLDRRLDRAVVQIEGLAQLPKGEYLRPALLGYHHL